MIALPCTSQIRYTIDDTEYTCYTKSENRAIAILLLQGERDSMLLSNCVNTISMLEAQVASLNNQIVIKDEYAKLANRNYENASKLAKKESKKNRFLKRIVWGELGVIGILVIVILV